MTFTEAIIDFINADADNPNVTLDLLPPDSAGNSLSPTERDVIVKRYINGRMRKRFSASLFACRLESEKLDAIQTIQRIQNFLETSKGTVIGNAYLIESTEMTSPAIKNRVGEWTFYGSSVTIEYTTLKEAKNG
jgi:hypothetical protein